VIEPRKKQIYPELWYFSAYDVLRIYYPDKKEYDLHVGDCTGWAKSSLMPRYLLLMELPMVDFFGEIK